MEYQQYRDEWNKLPEAYITSDFPLHLDIELTNRCNLRCTKCPHHGPDRINNQIPQDMDFDLYKKIIDEGSQKGLKAIKLNYSGEPLLYDKLAEAIHYARTKGILDIRINSNGTINSFDRLAFFELDYFIVTDYDSDIQKGIVSNYQKTKKNFGSKTPLIQIKTNDPKKWDGIADELGPNEYYEYNLEEDFTPSDFKCTQPWQRMLVLADGMVCSCSCGLMIPEKILGNAWHFSIEELWKGKQMQFLRTCHELRETHLLKQCRMCPARKEYVNKRNDIK